MNQPRRISVDPKVCHGKAHFEGTRIPVSVVLDNLASGSAAAEIVCSYPPLQLEDLATALAYAAELARERVVVTPTAAAA
jgi:uncharacterized protein (DUF433 family)